MDELDMQFKKLHDKIQLLLKQNQQLFKQNQALQKQNEALQATLADKDELLLNIRRQMEVLKLSKGSLAESDKSILAKRIDSYLADIEKCIKLIHS